MQSHTSIPGHAFPIRTAFVTLFALTTCTRGPRPAPSSGGDRSAAGVSSQMPAGGAGFDSTVAHHFPKSTCYVSARYVVVARDLENQVGSDLYVRPRGVPDAEPKWGADSVVGDIVFRTGDAASNHPDAQHFMGLKGDLLVAWDGTGARSDLYIYDLTKRTKVLELEGVDEQLEWVGPTTVSVWVIKAYAQRAVAAGCPDTVPGNPAELDSLMSLDLVALALRPTGRYRCTIGE